MNEPKPPRSEPPTRPSARPASPSAATGSSEPRPLGTLGWVGAVVLFALLAIALLSWLGPVQGR